MGSGEHVKKTCPVCAAPGDDLVFTFECTNPECQNFMPRSEQESEPQEGEPQESDSELDEYGSDWTAWSD
jgi:hypothetical protein